MDWRGSRTRLLIVAVFLALWTLAALGRLAYLQDAVKATLNDPALVAEGEKSQRYIDYLDADATRKNARDVVTDITPEQRKRVQDILAKAR